MCDGLVCGAEVWESNHKPPAGFRPQSLGLGLRTGFPYMLYLGHGQCDVAAVLASVFVRVT